MVLVATLEIVLLISVISQGIMFGQYCAISATVKILCYFVYIFSQAFDVEVVLSIDNHAWYSILQSIVETRDQSFWDPPPPPSQYSMTLA